MRLGVSESSNVEGSGYPRVGLPSKQRRDHQRNNRPYEQDNSQPDEDARMPGEARNGNFPRWIEDVSAAPLPRGTHASGRRGLRFRITFVFAEFVRHEAMLALEKARDNRPTWRTEPG
jgi:hypothetical protein